MSSLLWHSVLFLLTSGLLAETAYYVFLGVNKRASIRHFAKRIFRILGKSVRLGYHVELVASILAGYSIDLLLSFHCAFEGFNC